MSTWLRPVTRVLQYLPLLWGSLRRKRVRTGFTIGSIFIAFLLYALAGAMEPSTSGWSRPARTG